MYVYYNNVNDLNERNLCITDNRLKQEKSVPQQFLSFIAIYRQMLPFLMCSISITDWNALLNIDT